MGTFFDLKFQTVTSSEYSEICGRPNNLRRGSSNIFSQSRKMAEEQSTVTNHLNYIQDTLT
jgi:hypothetical protein